MSFSHADVSNQVADITKYIRMFDGCSVISHRTTNKRMVVQCTGRNVANNLVYNLKRNGYPIAQAASGLKTDAYYVEVRFNYPF